MKFLYKALLGLSIASSTISSANPVTLGDLQRMCHHDASDDQRRMGEVTFRCTKQVSFWRETGTTPFPLFNTGMLETKVHVKRSGSSWMPLHYGVRSDHGVCHDYAEYEGLVDVAVKGGCNLLADIQARGEEAFCEFEINRSGLNTDYQEEVARVKSGVIAPADMKVLQRVRPTGRTLDCKVGPSIPNPPSSSSSSSDSSFSSDSRPSGSTFSDSSTTSGPSVSSSVSSQASSATDSRTDSKYSSTDQSSAKSTANSDSHSSSSSSSSSNSSHNSSSTSDNSSNIADARVLGAKLKSVKTKNPKGGWRKKTIKAVEILEKPLTGSVLHGERLRRGDMVAYVGKTRVKSVKDFVKAMEGKSKNKSLKIIRHGQFANP